jgi:glutamine---fructose-6-phosphate transaminase (isomerizing)
VIDDRTFTGRVLPAVSPSSVAVELRPLLEFLPAPLLAVEIAVARGFDAESP